MKSHWWQWVLIGLILATVTIGLLYIFYSIISRLFNLYTSRTRPDKVPRKISSRLNALSKTTQALTTRKSTGKKASFGVYLGSFANPPTEDEIRVLRQWDILIVNPLESGVIDAIAAHGNEAEILGRLDLDRILTNGDTKLKSVEKLVSTLVSTFKGTGFRGVLLSGWEDTFNPALLKECALFINGVGLDVYLETSPPDFLKDGKALQSSGISGLVIRNASILPNGEKRDYFQMSNLQPTVKAFVSESCLRDLVVMAWETVDDNAALSNAVIKRSIQWCNFYSAIPWICTESSLKDASLSTKTCEPLGAFAWLKEAEVMKFHETWRSNSSIVRTPALRQKEWDTLEEMFPRLAGVLQSTENGVSQAAQPCITLPDPLDRVSQIPAMDSPLAISITGVEYNSLGCFPLGVDVSPVAFAEILQSQRRLKSLGLLHPVSPSKLQDLGILLRKFHENHLVTKWSHAPQIIAAIKELSTLASNEFLRVYLGLDSGFRKDAETRFWAVYKADPDSLDIFVSKDAQGLAGIVTHTFLSSRGFPRDVCFEVETELSRWSGGLVKNAGLPRRLAQDIDLLTPEERLLLLQHLTFTNVKHDPLETICTYIRTQLLEAPSITQLKELNTSGYLSGNVSPEELVKSRLSWYQEQDCQHPKLSEALALFAQVDENLSKLLRLGRESDLSNITSSMSALVDAGNIDAYMDIFALSLFCAMRKGAFDEVYTEVTDRNPLFNNQSDQAAAFAESFALGSRCESYFDVSPSVFGRLLSDRYRLYYNKNQPPLWVNGAPELATAYAGAQIDVDPNDKVKPLPGYQRFTFLSVFAIPALIDIVLLSTTGRGLYLSAFMTFEEQESATTALMISLLLSGAIGTWIACGGSYYLISMAFSAMNMFVLTRLIAGFAFTLAGSLIGFVVMSSVKGPRAGIIFFLYFIALTVYLTTFAAIASFSFPGTSFLSGRKIILICIPFLVVSPVVTMFTGHDSAIYIAVIYVFIGALVLGLRSVASKWVTWYQKIRRTDDTEVRKWYISAHGNDDEKVFGTMSDPAALKLARDALYGDVLAERHKSFFKKQTQDILVRELAKDWDATNFLLDWYCRYSDTPRPIPFSSSWNIQTKVALETLQSAQKGIRLHNAFIHWREAGDEVGCGVLYFVVALLDKWVEMLSGGHLIGLSASLTDSFRMATGFGLAYYLIGAVLIDTKAQHLHTVANRLIPEAIKTTGETRASQKQETKIKRQMYWHTLCKFLFWHVWSLAITATLIWTLQESLEAMIMFCAYVLAYTGLLWYQYTKIFSGPRALKPLLVAVVVGLPIGITMKRVLPEFRYTGPIALGACTWTVAILSLWTAKIGMPKKAEYVIDDKKTYHAHTAPWSDPEWSQEELRSFYNNLSSIPSDARYQINPSAHPGLEILSILRSHREDDEIFEAFPHATHLINWAVEAWERGTLTIELVPPGKLGPGIRALTCATEGHLEIAIGVGRGPDNTIDIGSNCQIVAEILVHSAAEAFLKIPHEYATLSDSLVNSDMSECMSAQLREEENTPMVMDWARREALKQLCFGFRCNTDWEKLPKYIRKILINRCLGLDCEISDEEWDWLQASLCKFDTQDLTTHIARCNLGAITASRVLQQAYDGIGGSPMIKAPETPDNIAHIPTKLFLLKKPFSFVYHTIGTIVKFFVISMVADPEFQREFDFIMSGYPVFLRIPAIFLLNLIWSYARLAQNIGLMFFMFHGRKNVKQLWDEAQGMTITSKRNRIIIQGLEGTLTAFKHEETGGFKLFQYSGLHETEPESGSKSLKCINTYSKQMILLSREDLENGKVVNEYNYEYQAPNKRGIKLSKGSSHRLPIGRRCVRGKNNLESVHYNQRGLIESGSYMKDDNLVRFKYHYRKNARFGDELLRAEFVLSHINCTVSWCAPPTRRPERVDRWIPHSKVTEATFVQGPDVYESRWLYDHKFHPTIFTTVNGQKVQTPPMIERDFLGVLQKPRHTNFVHDNPLFYTNNLTSNAITRLFGLSKQRFPVSTSRARSRLWKAWKDRVDFDGVIVRWMDERLLRRDEVLKPYWSSRNWGNLQAAKKYLNLRADAIMASADMDDNISSWTALAVKISDLFNFGPGGDAVVNTRSKDVGYDTNDTLHVIAADNGTWPNEGGGVSACRRDMVNSLNTIKWHMICESANDFGIPKHQTEQNVQSLKVIPLWGLDFLTPTHGFFKNRLDSEISNIDTAASDMDIRKNFIPTLTTLVKCARAVDLSSSDVRQATRALVNLNTYFQDSRHWGKVWTSDIVKEHWRDLWLTQEMPNATPSLKWFETELPTLSHLDTALDLWFRYLFIFSIPVPEKIPAVFQASHHSVSASYGIVCKIKRQCTLQIWDHAISWRETNICLSSALCKLPPFVRNALLGLMRMTSVLILHHADIILPCADFFNPGWEVEIGTSQGAIEHRNKFRRKVDPVVNGITDMQRFTPVKEIKAERPTVTMLSHVWYAKDIKTALLAADIIINEWGFDDYHLDIYGALDKAPTYSTECQEIVASKSLRGRATLRGTANPTKVLENTWLFLNSSLSEGLPLALGEAALTGAPVVCTDVGASLRVLSDPDDFSRFSAVVAPNDARALARAQINMLALLGEWSQYAEDTSPAPVLTSSPTREEVAIITKRMYEKSDQRRKLGMMTRNIVQKSFSGDRYLREHEQMLWIGKARKLMATRVGDDMMDPANATGAEINIPSPGEEEVITIPRSAVQSWRSTAASNMSSAMASFADLHNAHNTNGKGVDTGAASIRSGFSALSTDAESAFPRNSALPVFAPRASGIPRGLSPARDVRTSRSRSRSRSRGPSRAMAPDQLRGLDREELRLYRNSDVSTMVREDFLNSSAFNSRSNSPP
ncbi:hypothetical protein FQN54_009180 [Arachnomyces sp. PD_36]|nr:hypothetical protein FQN54_009180 [Arachnomyces sp. PD_36]